MTCKNVAELRKQIQKRIDDALANEVTDKLLETVDKHIQTDVYEKYDPMRYIRRYDEEDGLMSGTTSVFKSGSVIVFNNAPSNPHTYDEIGNIDGTSKNAGKLLAPMVEYGGRTNMDFHFLKSGWDGKDYSPYAPRPFMHNSYDDIIMHGHHVEALKRGLRRQGLKVK